GRGPVLERIVLQRALAAFVAHRAVQRVVEQEKLQHALAQVPDEVRLGADHQAVGGLHGAGGDRLALALHLHQAHAADAHRIQLVVVAEHRNFDARLRRRLHQAHAFGHFNFYAVERHFDELAHALRTSCGCSAKQARPLLWASNSSGKCFSTDIKNVLEKSESRQMVVPDMSVSRLLRTSTSSMVPWPRSILRSSRAVHAVPSRHGVHWPHDSWEKKSA